MATSSELPLEMKKRFQALAYYAIGVGSEGGDMAYQLSFCGKPHSIQPDGSHRLEPIGNSGYTLGEMQTDLGQHPEVAAQLVASFQSWATMHRSEWVLSDTQASRLAADLGRDGRHIRDPNYAVDNAAYRATHHHSLPDSALPATGQDIDAAIKARLDAYLASDTGKSFAHQLDVAQVSALVNHDVGLPLSGAPLYKASSADDQTKLFAMTAKLYNQSPAYAAKILHELDQNELHSISAVEQKISSFVPRDPHHPDKPTYLETGRDAALAGAELYNTLRHTREHNPIHAPWQAVAANPLVDPVQVAHIPAPPDFAAQYATVKELFVQPEQATAWIAALEQGKGSYTHGDPAHAQSRGLYAEGHDFLVWDRQGEGHAFVNGQWSDFTRNELTLSSHVDRTLDVALTRDGETRELLHVAHPTVHASHVTASHAMHGALHPGMHGDDVRRLQGELHTLGQLAEVPDGSYGPHTRAAVSAFQQAQGLAVNGIADPTTLQHLHAAVRDRQIEAMAAGAPAPSRDFSDPAHPRYAMYCALKEYLPQGTSEARLMQGTAACYRAGITDPKTLVAIDIGDTAIRFSSSVLGRPPATMDISQPAPPIEQSVQHVQQHDQNLAQWQAQFQARQAQVNAQAQQGPVLGGPMR